MGNNIDKPCANFIENVLPENVKYEDLPELEHKKEFVGSTDYIDNIFPTDLSHHVMRGIDHFTRKYIVVYYNGNIQTYFQRYSDSEYCWTYGEFIFNPTKKFLFCTGNIAAQPNIMATIKTIITQLLKSNYIEKSSPKSSMENLKDNNNFFLPQNTNRN
jgi:hypothetical protein